VQRIRWSDAAIEHFARHGVTRGVSFVQLAEQWIVEGVERDEAASR
jgi:hypothetical protein